MIITHPMPEVDIIAPEWMRRKYREMTGKTMEERYIEMTEGALTEILKKLLTSTETVV
jgi:hypothetical protein